MSVVTDRAKWDSSGWSDDEDESTPSSSTTSTPSKVFSPMKTSGFGAGAYSSYFSNAPYSAGKSSVGSLGDFDTFDDEDEEYDEEEEEDEYENTRMETPVVAALSPENEQIDIEVTGPELGKGSYGAVLKGMNYTSGTPVAVKVFDSDGKEDYEHELRTALAIRSAVSP